MEPHQLSRINQRAARPASPPEGEPGPVHQLDLVVNGEAVSTAVEARLLLCDFLRHRLGLTGTHVGCEQGSCGACTVLLDGQPVRSCLMLAVQARGAAITTIEGLAGAGDGLHPVQEAFHKEHAMQCGFCTPGLVMTLASLSGEERVGPDRLADHLDGHLCRCTGYENIRRAARRIIAVDEGQEGTH